ncbi:DUF4390 domain-containing protein [bacterium]|nr:DUF4390 domain-containing protein [candidate division CSSED10-310 bacterium]
MKFSVTRLMILPIFLWALTAAIAHPVRARTAEEQPRFKQFRWSETDTGYRVTSILQNGFNTEIEERINAGIPTSFHYFLSFKRVRWYWDNRILLEREYIHTVTYDTLRKLYTVVKRDSGNSEPIGISTTADFNEMRRLMNTFEGDIPIRRSSLKPNRRHYISIRAVLKTEKLPPPWDVILFFISNDFDTKTSRQFLPVTE